MPTINSGNSSRIPNTAIATPTVRKIFCQNGLIRTRTVALTTALSKLSDTSSTARIAASARPVPPPYHRPRLSPTTATISDPPNVRRNTRSPTQPARSADVHAEVLRDPAQAGAVSLADRPELPLVLVAVQL